MKGWDYARKNVDEATKVVLAADTAGAQTEKDQKRMMAEIAKLLDGGDGKLDPSGSIRISRYAASQRPSRVGFKPGARMVHLDFLPQVQPQVQVAGDPERRIAAQRRETGIPVGAGLLAKVKDVARHSNAEWILE